jgi:exosortase
VIFAYFFRKTLAERLIIVASAIPIAILVNAFRVALTGVLTHHIGQEAASGWIHQTEGMFTFAIAMVLLLAEAWILQKIWPRRRPTPSSRGETRA